MAGVAERKCGDCGGALHEIRLIDRGAGVGKGAHHHGSIQYTVPEAKRGLWTGQFPVEGKLAAYMCTGCARVSLYGVPAEDA